MLLTIICFAWMENNLAFVKWLYLLQLNWLLQISRHSYYTNIYFDKSNPTVTWARLPATSKNQMFTVFYVHSLLCSMFIHYYGKCLLITIQLLLGNKEHLLRIRSCLNLKDWFAAATKLCILLISPYFSELRKLE